MAPVDASESADEPAEPEELVPQATPLRSAPVRRTQSTRKLHPGDLICGECGEGNVPTRKFCGRCGTSLEAALEVGTPWWRKIFRRRGPKVMIAGARPGKPGSSRGRTAIRETSRKLRAAIGIIVVVAALLGGLYPPFRTAIVNQVTALKDKITNAASNATLSPIHPASVKVHGQRAKHPGKAAVDEFKNTYWLAPWPSEHPPELDLKLANHVALRKVIITIGASDDFVAHDRPAVIRFAYSNEKAETIVVKDTSKPQTFSLRNGLGTDSVKVQILDVFPAQKASDVAIGEIEFFGIG